MSAPLVLLVEEDERQRGFLVENLFADGFNVSAQATTDSALAFCAASFPDLALVSVNGGTGRQFVKDVRDPDSEGDVRLPMILMGSDRHELEVTRNLTLGADDYLARPFGYAELLARVTALLRRVDMHAPRAATPDPIEHDRLVIDPRQRSVTVDGCKVHMTVKTFALLRKLASDPQRVFTKAELLLDIWGVRDHRSTRTLDSHACRLRNVLGAGYVHNVWGVGYRLGP